MSVWGLSWRWKIAIANVWFMSLFKIVLSPTIAAKPSMSCR